MGKIKRLYWPSHSSLSHQSKTLVSSLKLQIFQCTFCGTSHSTYWNKHEIIKVYLYFCMSQTCSRSRGHLSQQKLHLYNFKLFRSLGRGQLHPKGILGLALGPESCLDVEWDCVSQPVSKLSVKMLQSDGAIPGCLPCSWSARGDHQSLWEQTFLSWGAKCTFRWSHFLSCLYVAVLLKYLEWTLPWNQTTPFSIFLSCH